MLAKTKVIFIDGYELMTECEGYKFSSALNKANNISNGSRCNVCDNELMFGGAVVVFIYGDRTMCREDAFSIAPDSLRMAVYKFTGDPEEWIVPSYTAPATTSEAFDKIKDLEMSGKLSGVVINYECFDN